MTSSRADLRRINMLTMMTGKKKSTKPEALGIQELETLELLDKPSLVPIKNESFSEIDVHSENVCIEEDVLAPFLKFFKGSSDSVVEEEEVGGVLEGSKERGDESEEAKKVCAEYPEPKPGHFVVATRGGYEYLEEKLMAEKTKKRLEEAAQSGSTKGIIDPPSPIRRHVKWKMTRTKKTGQMTSEAAKEIADRICSVQDSLDEQALQGSFIPHGRTDILTAAIGRPEHPGRVRAVGAGVTIKQYFGSASRTSRSSSSMPPEDLEQLTQQIRDQLEESITEKVTRKMMESFSQMQSQFQSQMQSHGLALPPEPEVGPSGPRVSSKESCVDPSRNNPGTGDSDKCGLYIEENPSCLVALGRLYEGSTTVHNIPLLHGQVKVGVEEVKDAEALVPVPTDEVTLVGQTLNTFLAWPTHLVKRLSEHAAVSPAKSPESSDEEVDDPLYLMTLIIPQLFLKPLQVMWDATIFGVFNQNFLLYIKHEDLSEIAHGGQCLSISIIQLWILHLTETSVRPGNFDVYGFLEPQSIQRSGQSQFKSESYIKSWIQSSKRDVYLGAYLNGPDNYLKGIINSALKGLDDTPQSKSKAAARWIVVKCNRQKGITECGYYVMHWMSTIILGSFRNNWETVMRTSSM
ncbi:hypothetical protein GmHk_01G000540 [Glycine max]|nr:hypothetical protein GmHk_01G000540 [Glycine max]